jgi:hypothetical protein
VVFSLSPKNTSKSEKIAIIKKRGRFILKSLNWFLVARSWSLASDRKSKVEFALRPLRLATTTIILIDIARNCAKTLPEKFSEKILA